MWIPRFPEGLLRTDRAQSLPVCGYSSILGGDGEHGVNHLQRTVFRRIKLA